MLVIDDNNLKLLKMKEKLLEIAVDKNLNSILEDYKRLARTIDESVYNELVNKIKETDYHNQSLEEQLSFLSEIEELYVEFYELQCRFRNIYEKYSIDSLELSNIDNVKIDIIRNRISSISGYLLNNKKIEDSKNELASFSDKLIEEEKKKEAIGLKLLELDKILRDNALNAEGRILDNMANIGYTSVITEYKNIGVDLELLFCNMEVLNDKLNEFEAKRREKEDLLNVAEICYNNMPNEDNRVVYDNIMLDTIRTRYELSLIKIASLLSDSVDQYDDAKKKREKLLDLIKYRIDCLKKLGVKFSIEPFNRIRVGEQLKIVESFEDNTKNILLIRKKISEINSNVELWIEKNNAFWDEINTEVELYDDGVSLNDFNISSVSVELEEKELVVQDNQVVGVSILTEGFMLERALEKSNGVIKRVNEMINHINEFEEESTEVTPELVIDSSTFDKELDINNDVSFYDEVIDSIDIDDSFSSEESDLSENVTYDDFLQFEDEPVLDSDFSLIIDNNKEVEEPVVMENEIQVSDNYDLFQEVVPFDNSVLFTDKYDEDFYSEEDNGDSLLSDELSNMGNDEKEIHFDSLDESLNLEVKDDSLSSDELLHINDGKEEAEFVFDSLDESLVLEEESMPDAFWITQDEESDVVEEEDTLSFDEQIDYLINQGNDVKVKRKVA